MSATDTVNKANKLLDVLDTLLRELMVIDEKLYDTNNTETFRLRVVINATQQRIIDINEAS